MSTIELTDTETIAVYAMTAMMPGDGMQRLGAAALAVGRARQALGEPLTVRVGGSEVRIERRPDGRLAVTLADTPAHD